MASTGSESLSRQLSAPGNGIIISPSRALMWSVNACAFRLANLRGAGPPPRHCEAQVRHLANREMPLTSGQHER
jgi:hypothetical protein